jgi:hypothetical protein
MNQRYGLLGIGMLIASAVIVSTIAIDPKAFVLREWQALVAAIIALGSAGIVYRSAMAKVELDREIHQTEMRRRERGLFLRLRFTAYVMMSDAQDYAHAVSRDDTWKKSNLLDWKFRTEPALEEAWTHLDAFPREIAYRLSDLKRDLFNFHNAVTGIRIQNDETALRLIDADEAARLICENAMRISKAAGEIFRALDNAQGRDG